MNVLIRRREYGLPTLALCLWLWGHGKSYHLRARKRALTRHWINQHLDLGPPSFQNHEKLKFTVQVTPSMSFVTAAWTDRDRRGRIVARVCWIVNIPGSVGHLPTIRPWLQPTIRETPSAEGEGKVRGRLVWVSHRMPLFFMWEGNMLLAHWSHRYTVSFRLLVP